MMSTMIISLPGEMGHDDLCHMVALSGQVEDKVFSEQMAMTQSHSSYNNSYNKQGIGWMFLMALASIHREMNELKDLNVCPIQGLCENSEGHQEL